MSYLATNKYRADGTNTNFPFSFPVIDLSHVKVTVDGVAAVIASVSAGNTILANPPGAGTVVVVYRETPITTAAVSFSNSSTLLDSDLNAADVQLLYSVQEAFDRALDRAFEIQNEAVARAAADALEAAARLTADTDEAAARLTADESEAIKRTNAFNVLFEAQARDRAFWNSRVDQEVIDRNNAIKTAIATAMANLVITSNALYYSGSSAMTINTTDIADKAVTLAKIGDDAVASFKNFTQVGTGAATILLADKVAERLEIIDFIPSSVRANVRAGTADVSPYAQALFNQLMAQGGGRAHFGPGKWTFYSQVTWKDVDIAITGDGPEVTRFRCLNSTGIFAGSDTTANGQAGHSLLLAVRDVSFVAANPGSNGTALTFSGAGTANPVAPGTPQIFINNVNWRSTGYTSSSAATSTDPYWKGCLKLVSVWGVHMSNFHMVQISNNVANMLEIDNDKASSAFKFDFVNFSIQGGYRSAYLHGWLESISMTNFEMAAVPIYGLVTDFSTNIAKQPWLPVIALANAHMYGATSVFICTAARSIHLTNINSYLEPVAASSYNGVASSGQQQFNFINCQEVLVNNCVFEAGGNANNGTDLGYQAIILTLNNVTDTLVTNSRFFIKGATTNKSNRCIQFQGTVNSALVHGNILRGTGSNVESGVFVQATNTDERVTVKSNHFRDLAYMVVAVAVTASRFTENDGYGITTGVGVNNINPTNNAGVVSRNNVLS